MRGYYQTEEDLRREREVADVVCARYGLEPVKLPDYTRLDFMLHRDGIAEAVLEIKCRNISSAKYDTYMLSKGKYDAMLDWLRMGFKVVLAVRWTDTIGIVRLPVDHTEDIGGRTDRNDALDIERVVHIPIERFRMLTPQ